MREGSVQYFLDSGFSSGVESQEQNYSSFQMSATQEILLGDDETKDS